MSRKSKPRFTVFAHGKGSFTFDAKRGKVRYQFTPPGGTRLSVYGATEDQCLERMADKLAALGDVTPKGSLKDLCDRWYAAHTRDKAASTKRNYLRDIHHILDRLGADTLARDVTPAMVLTMLDSLVEAGLGKRTIDNVRGRLSMACEWGAKRNLIPSNPVAGLRTPEGAAVQSKRPEDRSFTRDEYERVLDHLTTEHSTVNVMFLVMLQCGLRPGEARSLRWADIDWTAGTLRADTAISETDRGTFEPSDTMKTDHTMNGKNRKAHRTIQMTSELHAALRREAGEQMARGRGEHIFYPHVCRSMSGKTAPTRIAKAAGVKRLTANEYRHTFASLALDAGLPVPHASTLMGHNDTRMITTVYAHLLADSATIDTSSFLARRPEPRAVEG